MRTMTIEQALAWAYRAELPKADAVPMNDGAMAGGWDAMLRYGETFALVDASRINGYGLVVDGLAALNGATPHVDALAIAEAVAALDDAAFGLPEGWSPLDDFGDLGADAATPLAEAVRRGTAALCAADADGRMRLKTPPSRLVVKHALLGGEPDWRCERPEVRPVLGVKGGTRWFRRVLIENRAAGGWIEIEGDGWNERRKRPYADAYRKHRLDPDPAAAVTARGEYEIWRAALDLLVDDLGERGLTEIAALPSAAPARPWLGDGRIAPRVLRAREAESAARVGPVPRGARKQTARIA